MSKELHNRLQGVVVASGLWNGGAGNRNFLLSPSVYELTLREAASLEILGRSIKRCFAGLNRMAANASNSRLGHSPAWRLIRASLSNGVSKIFTPLQQLNPEEDSLITKVDLMEDNDGRLWIAEIDGYNPRGMGYSTLTARMAGHISNYNRLPGVVPCLARELHRRGQYSVVFLYADRERFYLPEFTIFRDEMARNGISVTLLSELDLNLDTLGQKLFVVFPQMDRNISQARKLAELYREGQVSFLIPPKPYLGSKSTLALLKNEEQHEELEQVLLEHIAQSDLETLRRYIPPTYLVGKNSGQKRGQKTLELHGWQKALAANGHSYVLKLSVSSGMKGVFFEDDPQYPSALDLAGRSQGHYVLQREVKQLNRSFDFFRSADEIGSSNDWHTRVTAHIIGDQLADLTVTARRDKRVHGATDCLLLGTVLV